MSSVYDSYWSRDYHDNIGIRVLISETRVVSHIIVIQLIPIVEINPLLKVMIETKNIFGVVQEEQVTSQVVETSHQSEIHSLNIKISIRKKSIKSEYFFISLKIKADG